jgi:hypothetical protein
LSIEKDTCLGARDTLLVFPARNISPFVFTRCFLWIRLERCCYCSLERDSNKCNEECDQIAL